MTSPDPFPANSDRILVFIPAYNCAPQIGRVLAQFHSVPPNVFAEILVVDNQSTDATFATATEAAALVPIKNSVVRNDGNYGLGGSHKSAFAYAASAGFTHVVVLHGDAQGTIDDLLPILVQGLHRTYDCCLGSRFAHGSRLRGYAFLRRLGNHVFNALFSLVSRRRITDLGSGLNIINRATFTDPAILRFSDDLRFNCYLLLNLVDSHRRFRFFPISWAEDDQVSNVKIVSQSLRTLQILWQYLFRRRDFRERDHRALARPAYSFTVPHPQGTTQ